MSDTDAQHYVRRCRGHWHVVGRNIMPDARDGSTMVDDDICGPGDPFKSEAAAQRVVDALNRGEPWPAPAADHPLHPAWHPAMREIL